MRGRMLVGNLATRVSHSSVIRCQAAGPGDRLATSDWQDERGVLASAPRSGPGRRSARPAPDRRRRPARRGSGSPPGGWPGCGTGRGRPRTRLAPVGGHDVQDGRLGVGVEGARSPAAANRQGRLGLGIGVVADGAQGAEDRRSAATGSARRRRPGGPIRGRAASGPSRVRTARASTGRSRVGDDPVEESEGAEDHRPHARIALGRRRPGPGPGAGRRPAGPGRTGPRPRCPRPGCTARGGPGRPAGRPGARPWRSGRRPGSSPSHRR